MLIIKYVYYNIGNLTRNMSIETIMIIFNIKTKVKETEKKESKDSSLKRLLHIINLERGFNCVVWV